MFKRSYINGHEDHTHFITNKVLMSMRSRYSKIDNMGRKSQLLKTLSDPTRLKIFMLLTETGELPVTDISSILDLGQSTTSHALSDLKSLGLVDCSRCGQLKCYSITEVRKSDLSEYASKVVKSLDIS